MHKDQLFQSLKTDLENKIRFLEDKPEETVDTSLKALWFTACGLPKSAEEAAKQPLPELTEEQLQELNHLINLRLNQKPLAYLTGRQNFMGLELLSDERALIPRKETEILGQKALELSLKIVRTKKNVKMIDVCCGAGNLGIAIAHFNPDAEVYTSDLSPEAVELTRENISFQDLNQRIQVKQGDLFSGFESEEFYEKIDLIVCNPPYISSSKVSKMPEEILANEPALAFDGGMMGIKIIQKLLHEAPKYLTKAGWLIFEVGAGQGQFILQLCEKANQYNFKDSVMDGMGNIRVVMVRKE
jgi:release factor glutamine methyltransferase